MGEKIKEGDKVDDSSKDNISKMLDKIIQGKINSNRRYIDSILEMIQDKNREYYLAKFVEEMKAKEEAEKAGKLHEAMQHNVMAQTFKSIAERCFAKSG